MKKWVLKTRRRDEIIMVNIGNHWDEILAGEFEKEYYQRLRQFLIAEYRSKTIYPDMHDIFNALKYTDDHGPGQAHGMSFSVRPGIKQPPSLVNIFKELKDDLGLNPPDHGYLVKWAEQGVLLLNTCLTVREHQPNSHKGKGWEIFTDQVIRLLNQREKPMVFILWGGNAKSKQSLITNSNHLILTGAHPSPLSAYNGFYGGQYFSKANAFLEDSGQSAIDLSLIHI